MSLSLEEDFPLHRVLAEDGSVVGTPPNVAEDHLVDWFRWMITMRTFDQRAWNLQRQGKIGTYAPFSGQEAAQIGCMSALRADDWIASSYREWAGLAYFGVPLVQPLLSSAGHPDGGCMPESLNVLPIQVVIGAQLLHGVGLAWASKLQQQGRVAMTVFGDGATSQGDFHEALNLASVMKLPAIFVCQNNRWAISLPVERQMNVRSVAQRALAYDIDGFRVDGNDVLATAQVMRSVVDRVRQEQVPVLVELVTYRLGAHTTADDPTRYRDAGEQAAGAAADPLVRYAAYLTAQGLLDAAARARMQQEAQSAVDHAVAELERRGRVDAWTVFDQVYATRPAQLEEQRHELQQRVLAHRADGAGGGAR
ncbi:MAG: pyruvate dehydrogenase (acetyl-transferring) E1 component subunit alpha [Thermaerobacter sp.]|nr:pyruvate dehydrogenase (acetyl-transferring) E1 component subunit alpha [Thermaerobacter sp.]